MEAKAEKATIFHIARYLVEHLPEMTAMKLQKLCFYCQAWNLAWEELPLFEENFEAWANGPISPKLFNMHKGLYSIPSNFLEAFAGFPLKEYEKENIDIIIREYGNCDPRYLSELTHSEIPWQKARAGIPNGVPCSNVIEKEDMLIYYQAMITNNEELEEEFAKKQWEEHQAFISKHGQGVSVSAQDLWEELNL